MRRRGLFAGLAAFVDWLNTKSPQAQPRENPPMPVRPDQIELVETCSCSPEQYDAFLAGEPVGYLRLRYGYFAVECPGPCDGVVYDWDVSEHDPWLPRFTEADRIVQLQKAREAIADWVNKRRTLVDSGAFSSDPNGLKPRRA